MKNVMLSTALALGAIICSASGQAQPANDDNNAAVKDTHAVDTNGPSRGANSFTEGQARGHIQIAGFTGVSKLHKDSNGVWRGTAVKNRHRVSVAVDFKGDVTTSRR